MCGPGGLGGGVVVRERDGRDGGEKEEEEEEEVEKGE